MSEAGREERREALEDAADAYRTAARERDAVHARAHRIEATPLEVATANDRYNAALDALLEVAET